MIKETRTKKEAIEKLITKIHQYISRWKDAEAEICVGLIELQKLQPETVLTAYKTFSELLEGEFGWTELKYNSAKSMMLTFGMERYKEYGRSTLQALCRLESEVDKGHVFDKINEYKRIKGGKVPTYQTVNKWVNEISGKLRENGTPEKVVDIKSKYLKTLEENRSLREQINLLEMEIARLNNLLGDKPSTKSQSLAG